MRFKAHIPSKFILTLATGVIVSLLLFWALPSGTDELSVHAQSSDTPTPEATSTPEPIATPITDSCLKTISADGTVNGSWDTDCGSESRDGSYASYYTFILAESAEISITSESSVDTYLYLREGAGRDGPVLHENDDIVRGNTNSQIQETLSAEAYTIEVTTYDSGATGDFTLTVSGLPAAVQPTPTPEPTIIITFGDLNWPSAMLQNRIAQYIAEMGYGYSTSVASGATRPLFHALRAGNIDVLMEVWLPNQEEDWEAALAEGAISSPGRSLDTDWQSAFVIPKYLQEQYPDLDSVEDLKEEQYRSLFATDETDGKARLVSCVVDWSCEGVNAKQIAGYGLSEHIHIVNPGDEESLNADLFGAYDNEEPWLGYQWGTNNPALLLDLVRLDEPAYSDECWSTTMACAYEDSTILIAVKAGLSESVDDFVDVLTEWDFNVDGVYKPVVRWQADNPDANMEDAALWWLRGNQDIWSEWVTAGASAAIQSALDGGETPEGWPEEPNITPDPTPTPEPSPTPQPTDECVAPVSGNGTITGSWSSDCASEGRSGSYASYHTFTLAESAEVTITAESTVDTYLFLREGAGRDGSVETENDDHGGESDCTAEFERSTDSCIVHSLDAGTYTIEVSTYTAGETGDFTLTVSGLPDAVSPTPEPSPTPSPSPDPTPTPTPGPADECVGTVSGNGTITGNWSSDCASEGRSGSYASYHTFTLEESAEVTITAESTVDTYLFLREGAGRDGSVEAENDDHAGESDCTAEFERSTDSCIVHSLDAGTYTIEVSTYDAREIGDFMLTIGGLPAVVSGPSTDRAALVTLYNATNGANWTESENWGSDEPLSEWHGVTTDDDGRVTQIELWENNLIGSIPAELGNLSRLNLLALQSNQLSGEIPTELAGLASLLELSLWGNQLTGEIPSELGDLSNLQRLHLDGNELSGGIPAELGRMHSLEILALGGNQLNGEIPSELGDLSNLTELYLWDNQLTGEIPAELGDLQNLQRLDLGDSELSGEIPVELGSLANLERLYLNENELSGEIPSELGDLSNLRRLYLDGNELSGAIPIELGSLANLELLYLNENELSGEIPSELGDLSNLRRLYLDGNELSGAIPTELGSLANLELLYLNENELSGEIPSELGDLSNLRRLYLDGNELSGAIPTELGDLSSLVVLDFGGNQLSGEIPSELGELSNLTFLNLTSNEVSGEIPEELGRMHSLEILALGGNQLSGEIPTELAGLASLLELSLWGNQLSGEIPAELGDLSNLTELSLWGNQLTGEIPAELGELSNLWNLRFDENELSGAIPTELGSLANLELLYLNENELSGEIPSELGNLSNLERMYLYHNQLSGEIPSELGDLSSLVVLDFGGNQLSGEIPAELGDLSNLFELSLSGNQLTGEIPAELGDLSNLTELSLSGNQLTGEIPAELGDLSNLAVLSIGGNQLTGEIPTELGSLANLELLYLYNNQLTGDVPSGILAISGLRFMSLYGNQLSADVPQHTEERATLTTIYNSTGGTEWKENENWGSSEPVFKWNRVFIDTSGRVTALWLAENELSGEIPPELGSLTNLARLYLDTNQLTGEIPSELGNLENLEHLFLAGNNLSGCIPVELQDVPRSDFADLDLEFCSDGD